MTNILKESYPFYLGGEPCFANEDLAVYNKYDNKEVTRVAKANDKDIEKAIQLGIESQEELRKMGNYERKEILESIVTQVKKRADEFAKILAIEAGKPIKDAKGEVQRLIDTFSISVEECTRLSGEFFPLDVSERAKGCMAFTKRFPIGLIAMITPWNFPLNLVAHKIAPAIATGCPFILKPASRTPLGALLLGEILSNTKLPKKSFSILPCNREDASKLIKDERIKVISFTGSTEQGWKIKEQSGKKRVILELGGNAACVVDKDIDMEHVTERLIFGAFYQSGQSCISIQRVFIHEEIYEEMKNRLTEKIKSLKMGDPLKDDTFIGPIISEKDAERIEEWINEAVTKGANVLTGGRREGNFVQPTMLEKVPKNCKLYKEEVFGPVFYIDKFSTFKEAIDKVNDTKYGLNDGVFSNNIHNCFYAFENIEAGTVVINEIPSFRVDPQPYGGVKDSGIGREGIRFTMQEYTEIKCMLMRKIGNL